MLRAHTFFYDSILCPLPQLLPNLSFCRRWSFASSQFCHLSATKQATLLLFPLPSSTCAALLSPTLMSSSSNDGAFKDVRAMWQFPATYQLLRFLCPPLNISVPTPSQLEQALYSPYDHINLLANIHGRLLGLAAGHSSAKKWLQSTARFVRINNTEFMYLSSLFKAYKAKQEQSDPSISISKNDSGNDAESKQGQNQTEEQNQAGDDIQPQKTKQTKVEVKQKEELEEEENEVFVFPLEFSEYVVQFSPAIRLLVLHTIAEMVLAEHDKLLATGSINEIATDVLRCEPIGKDALNNRYWYFDDCQRVYREPRYIPSKYPTNPAYKKPSNSKKDGKRSTNAKSSSSNLDADDGPSTITPNPSKGTENMQDTAQSSENVQDKSSEPKTRSVLKEQTDRLVEDIFGPADISQNSMVDNLGELPSGRSNDVLSSKGLTNIATIFEELDSGTKTKKGSKAKDSSQNEKNKDEEIEEKPKKRKRGRPKLTPAEKKARKEASLAASAPSPGSSRRTSGRIRRQPERHNTEPLSSPTVSTTRPAKRPRVVEVKFIDTTLRKCDQWETLTVGAKALQEIIERFSQENDGTGLIPERSLIRRLRENVLPLIQEEEEKIRREQERKQRTEILFATQKRSTRLEAITLRKAEEARRMEEEEAREKQKEQDLYEHEQDVFANITIAERELSRDIRKARRLYGIEDESTRDDEIVLKPSQNEEKLKKDQNEPKDDDYVAENDADDEEDSSVSSGAATPNTSNISQGLRRSTRTSYRTRGRYAHYAIIKDKQKHDELKGNESDEDNGRPESIAAAAVAAVAARMKDGVKEVEKSGQHVKDGDTESKVENVVKEEDGDVVMGSREKSETSDTTHGAKSEEASKDSSAERKPKIEPAVEKADEVEELKLEENRSKSIIFTSGCIEELVSDDFTWEYRKADNSPCRVLDRFFFASGTTFAEASLEVCDTNNIIKGMEIGNAAAEESSGKSINSNQKEHIIGIGLLIPPSSSPAKVQRIEIPDVKGWVIEYGREPKLWVRSKTAWYELREAASEYTASFANVRAKFEICARLGIIGETMRGPMLAYDSIVELLGMRYLHMDGYDEEHILANKRFIVQQLENLGRRSILQCGFFKSLLSKIRAEDRKLASAAEKVQKAEKVKKEELIHNPQQIPVQNEDGKDERTYDAESSKTQVNNPSPLIDSKTANSSTKVGTTPAINKSDETRKNEGTKPAPSSTPIRKKSVATGKKPVPRVVSSIVSTLVKSATKSQASKRKKRPEGDGEERAKTKDSELDHSSSSKKSNQQNTIASESAPEVLKNGTIAAPKDAEGSKQEVSAKCNGTGEKTDNVINHSEKTNGTMKHSKISDVVKMNGIAGDINFNKNTNKKQVTESAINGASKT